MIASAHAALAVAQFAGAVSVALLLCATLGTDVRSVLLANLAIGLLLPALVFANLRRGTLSFNRRSLTAWPSLGILIVPAYLTGWDIEGASWLGGAPLALSCSLPFALLLALQTSVLMPVASPPESEVARPGQAAPTLTYLVLALVFGVVFVGLSIRSALAPHGRTVLVLSLLASAYALNGIHCSLAPALHLAGRGALLPRFAAAAAALNLLLNLALVPVLGVAGAALSTLACFAALAAATFAAARRDVLLPVEESRLAKIILSAAIVVLATMRWPAGSSWALVSAHVATALIGFPLVLSLSGFFRPHERQAVRRFFGLRQETALQ